MHRLTDQMGHFGSVVTDCKHEVEFRRIRWSRQTGTFIKSNRSAKSSDANCEKPPTSLVNFKANSLATAFMNNNPQVTEGTVVDDWGSISLFPRNDPKSPSS